MKKFIIAAMFLAIMTTPVHSKGWQERCSDLGAFAKTVMEWRQNGTTMQQAMEYIGDRNRENYGHIVIAAYETSFYRTPKYKKRAIQEFENKWYLWCYKRKGK